MKHAGIHWPENAGGEHPNAETILGMPGILHGCTLICSPSARYWYRQTRGASPLVVWRAIPRQGKLPAQLGWDAKRVAEECLNLWDEQPHGGTEWFLPLNELQFVKELGGPFPGYYETSQNLWKLRQELRRRLPGVGLMFPAWVPSDDGERLSEWAMEAKLWDAVCLVPDQNITARWPTAATMRRYEGDVVTIQTAAGDQLTVTPNHPVLTRQGWLPAGEIHEGAEIAKYAVTDTSSYGPNDVNVPTPISEVFRALNQIGASLWRRGFRHDFHGDGFDSDIQVVLSHRQLRGTFTKPLPDLVFPVTSARDAILPSTSNAPSLLIRPGARASTVDFYGGRSAGDDAQGFIRPLLGSERLRFTAVAQGPSATHEQRTDASGVPFETFGNLSRRLPGQIATVRVVNVNRRLYSGHVYNLTTQDGLIIADNIITHNCLHTYGDAKTQRARYQSYRDAFGPTMPLFVGEWNSNHDEADDEREALQMWADVAATDPAFMGATYYIWETRNAGEGDLSILGNSARLALFRDPPTVSLPPPVEPEPMTEYEVFIRDAAQKRGIDPDIAVRVANSEGSVTEPARRGTFDTGSSWWAFQLHYGGAGYEYLGTAAGMGNGFTTLTGWQPGDPKAWRDAARYALNRVKLNGWGAFYGAAHVGIGQWDGIDRDRSWNANSETWDYEAGVTPMPPAGLPYDPDAVCDVQPDDWSCSVQSTQWLLRSIGRNPQDAWMEQQLVPGIVSKDLGLLNASGEDLAGWINREYGAEMGFEAHAAPVTFDDVLAGAGTNPTIVGGRHYGPGGHWVGIRRHDEDGLLELANPAPNYQNSGTHLDRQEWDRFGPWSAIWIDRMTAQPAPEPVPVPEPIPDPRPSRILALTGEIRERLAEIETLAGVR